MFNSVQPLYSLTQDQKKYKFRQPPEITDFDELVEFYIERVSRANVIDDTLHLLEIGLPLEHLTRFIIRLNVAEGVHTIEQGLLMRPILFEYLKGIATDAGVDFKERFDNKSEREEKALNRAVALAKKGLKGRTKDEGVEMLMAAVNAAEGQEEMGMQEEAMPLEEAPMQEESAQLELDLGTSEEKPAGLMAR